MSELGVRYLVVWCAGCPDDECGDADIDRADMRYERCSSFPVAVRRAKELLRSGKDFWGCIEVQKEMRDEMHWLLWDVVATETIDNASRRYTEREMRRVGV